MTNFLFFAKRFILSTILKYLLQPVNNWGTKIIFFFIISSCQNGKLLNCFYNKYIYLVVTQKCIVINDYTLLYVY